MEALPVGDILALALQHHLTLELSHTSQDVEHQLAGRCAGIDAEIDDPQVAALLSDFLAEHGLVGHNPLTAIEPTPTKAELMVKHGAALRADYETASRDLEAIEAEMGETRPVPVKPALVAPIVVPVEPVAELPVMPKRGRGRPRSVPAGLLDGALVEDDE